MQRFYVGDVVEYYFTEEKTELQTVHAVLKSGTMCKELGFRVWCDAYIWKEADGCFAWDEKDHVDGRFDKWKLHSPANPPIEEPSPTSSHYPHTCTRCGAPAYKGLNDVDCSSCGRY